MTDILAFLAVSLSALSVKIGNLLTTAATDTNFWTLISLFSASFLYGLIHAAGPGHGKALVASYFSSCDKTYSKAFLVALYIGIVHTLSALILTTVGYFLISQILDIAIYDTNKIMPKISGAITLLLGAYLLYVKIVAYKKSKKIVWAQHIACSCKACSNNLSTPALVLSAAIVPCPGTITIFLLAISLGSYFLAFISALVMSMGMALIIFIGAFLSIKFRQKAKRRFSNYIPFIDFASVIVIIFLGLALLLFA